MKGNNMPAPLPLPKEEKELPERELPPMEP
jgi:hypothetical protein